MCTEKGLELNTTKLHLTQRLKTKLSRWGAIHALSPPHSATPTQGKRHTASQYRKPCTAIPASGFPPGGCSLGWPRWRGGCAFKRHHGWQLQFISLNNTMRASMWMLTLRETCKQGPMKPLSSHTPPLMLTLWEGRWMWDRGKGLSKLSGFTKSENDVTLLWLYCYSRIRDIFLYLSNVIL